MQARGRCGGWLLCSRPYERGNGLRQSITGPHSPDSVRANRQHADRTSPLSRRQRLGLADRVLWHALRVRAAARDYMGTIPGPSACHAARSVTPCQPRRRLAHGTGRVALASTANESVTRWRPTRRGRVHQTTLAPTPHRAAACAAARLSASGRLARRGDQPPTIAIPPSETTIPSVLTESSTAH